MKAKNEFGRAATVISASFVWTNPSVKKGVKFKIKDYYYFNY